MTEMQAGKIKEEMAKKIGLLKEEAKKEYPLVVREAIKRYLERMKAKLDILQLCVKEEGSKGA